MATTTEYCLRWVNYEPNAVKFFSSIYQKEALADVTLVSQEGELLKAHKLVLAACSPYFQTIFENNTMNHPHPVIVLKDISYVDLEAVLCFVYKGVVNVAHERIKSVLSAATSLRVKGLSSGVGAVPGDGFIGTPSGPSEPVRNVTTPSQETKSDGPAASLPVIADHGSPHVRKKPRVSPPAPVVKSDNNSSFYESDQQQRGSNLAGCSTMKIYDHSSSSNGPSDTSGSRLLDALTHAASSNSSIDEFQNIDSSFSATLRNVKVEEDLPDDLCEVGFDEPDGEELISFDEHSSLADLILPSTSAAAQHFMTSNELVVHPSAGRGDTPPVLTPENVTVADAKPNVKNSGSNNSNRKPRRAARRFKCEICGKAFHDRVNCLRHATVHSGVKEHVCDICNRAFARKDTLKKHKFRTHS